MSLLPSRPTDRVIGLLGVARRPATQPPSSSISGMPYNPRHTYKVQLLVEDVTAGSTMSHKKGLVDGASAEAALKIYKNISEYKSSIGS